MQNVKTFIEVWNRDEDSLLEDYGSAYQFALYICGGDFTQWDDINLLVSFLSKQPILPRVEHAEEEVDELPF
jgi:hypothetical protein